MRCSRIAGPATSIWQIALVAPRRLSGDEFGLWKSWRHSRLNLTVVAEKLGSSETLLLHISLHTHSDKNTQAFNTLINELPEVLECYTVTGEYDYQLNVLATDMRSYYRFLEEKLMCRDFIARTSSTVIMKKIKETWIAPVALSLAPPAKQTYHFVFPRGESHF